MDLYGRDPSQYYMWGSVLTGGGILMAILGYFLARTKGNGCWGCGLGCLLGPLGILIAMLIPESRRM
jgi:hypothetical protein